MNHELSRTPETDPGQIERMNRIDAAWETYEQLSGNSNMPNEALLRLFASEYLGTYTDLEILLRSMTALDEHTWQGEFRITRDRHWLHLYGTRRQVTETVGISWD